MSNNTLNLSLMKQALDRKHGHTPVDLGDGNIVTLLNPTRLPREPRKKLLELQDIQSQISDDDVDGLEDMLRDLISSVCQTPEQAEALLSAIDEQPGDSLILLSDIMKEYLGDQGEASPSES